MKYVTFLVISLLLLPLGARAQAQAPSQPAASPQGKDMKDPQEERLKALEDRLRELETEVRELRAARAAQVLQTAVAVVPTAVAGVFASPAPAAQSAPQGSGAPGGQIPIYGGATAMAKVLNPDISVIGDFVGALGKSNVPDSLIGSHMDRIPALEMHESEVGFQAVVDPYARADFFLSFGEQGVNLEEGYMTLTALPLGMVAKVGKFRSAFGIVNTTHNHVLPWIDRPIVTNNLVGGEDGINDAGLSVDRIWAGPKGIVLETTGQVLRGDSGDVFKSSQRSDASVVGHLRAYRDLTESANLDLGFSYARGHNDLGSAFLTNLYGVDATLRWKPLRRSIYHSFLWRSEFMWSRRDQLPMQQRAFGFYSAADYRLNRRWTVGGRFDRSERSRFASLTDNGGSVVLTYWPSEFTQVRGQYRFTHFAEGRDGNELLFQFLFVLGAHGAHPF